MSSSYSPRSSPGSSRLHLLHHHLHIGSTSRLRSSSFKKPPEPLRKAVADCLSSSSSSSSPASLSSSVASPAFVATEASRTLRDYLASSATTDLAYSVILEHTIAERERSPAVVAKCVTLLKRYLLRYKPSEETLLQIDRFCLSIIAECNTSSNRRSSPWSRSLNQHSLALTTSTNSSPFPVSSFTSGPLVKSLSYVRSLVAQHIPKRLLQRAAFAGVPSLSKQSLPSLSSFLRKSFNTQLSPANGAEATESRDVTAITVSSLSNVEKVDAVGDFNYIAVDVLKWRWLGEHQLSFMSTESGRVLELQQVNTHNFLELGAAALLVEDVQAKRNGQPWKYIGKEDMPHLEKMLQLSSVTEATDSASVSPHLRAITASKRNKAGPQQIWEDMPVSTFRPRAKPLFQYRHYSEQQPLRLNSAEVSEVIASVFSETYSSSANQLTISARLSHNSGKPSIDVAVSVLIKLVIDMYVMNSETAAPLTLWMLEEMLNSPKAACRVRAFDLILNLGVHAQLLEPIVTDEPETIEDMFPQGAFLDSEDLNKIRGQDDEAAANKPGTLSAIDNFLLWILNILYDILLFLVQREENEESVWASALSCLLYFVCDRGRILRKRLNGLDIRVIKALIEISRWNSWAELVHSKLVCMLTNMFYKLYDDSAGSVSKPALFLVDQVDRIGGIEFIFFEYSIATLREERRNLFGVLFDYVLHQINEICIEAGVSEYNDDEAQPIAALLILADAPEAFHISVKLGLEGIGEILRRSVSIALTRYPSNERLNTLLENLIEKFDSIISSYTRVNKEFCHLIQITKSYKELESINSSILGDSIYEDGKLAWASLRSLLHSERIPCRRNGYIWLSELLSAEISKGRATSMLLNIQELRKMIAYAGAHDPSATSGIPSSIWIMCELLKSKYNAIRCGFLVVLERLLMRCKFLLDEKDMQHSDSTGAGQDDRNSLLEKAEAVIDLMGCALSLVAQINETDRINILKMCDILFAQLCLKVPSGAAAPRAESMLHNHVHGTMGETKRTQSVDHVTQQENWNERLDEADCGSSYIKDSFLKCETASMAAMFLRGQAIVPTELVARVPAVLFYWPLIQLAGAATDNIALGVAVGSKGKGHLAGAATDIRATLLLLLIGKCTEDPSAFQEVGGEEFFRELLDDTDARVAYYSAAFLLKRMMTDNPEEYQHVLQNLVSKAQQTNNEKLLENPYLQMRGIIQLTNDGL